MSREKFDGISGESSTYRSPDWRTERDNAKQKAYRKISEHWSEILGSPNLTIWVAGDHYSSGSHFSSIVAKEFTSTALIIIATLNRDSTQIEIEIPLEDIEKIEQGGQEHNIQRETIVDIDNEK